MSLLLKVYYLMCDLTLAPKLKVTRFNLLGKQKNDRMNENLSFTVEEFELVFNGNNFTLAF